MLAIDRHAWTNRWRSHHPGERLLLAGGGLLLALMLPPLGAGPLLVVVMAAATVAGAGVPMRAFMGVMAVPAGFLLAGAPFLALSLDLHDGVHLGWSAAGAVLALKVSLRALGATACLAFLALTTPAAELVPWLRRLGVPAVLVEIALLIYRLIFILMERAAAGQQAQAARLGYRDARRSLRSLAFLTATLFQRALERARRLEVGLAARGYAGELRVLAPARVLSPGRLETFVDPRYFHGTLYRAANWLYVGDTRGFRRTRGGYSDAPGAVKRVFVRPLHPQAQARLARPVLDPHERHGASKLMLSAEQMGTLPEFFADIPDSTLQASAKRL